jgi:peptide/nickel transport system substrate-binding protein
VRLAGPGGAQQLDPAAVHAGPAVPIVRLFSRQLVTYEPCADLRDWQAICPVPDVAVHVPSTYNAGLGASQRSYVVQLRPGVSWDTDPPRPVTAPDFVRGFKRMANPVAPSPALAYFAGTVRGMAEFRAGFVAAVPPAFAGPAQLSEYQNGAEIAGVFALDDETLVIELLRPAPDFPDLLTLPCASAAPVEYDAFVPGSPELRRNLRSNGPYRLAGDGTDGTLRLERNPAWSPESDPVRSAHVDRVEVVEEARSATEIRVAIDAGAADLAWAPALRAPAADGEWSGAAPVSWALDPYLVLNVAGGSPALGDVRVRRAIAAAIDREALAELYRRHGEGGEVRVANRIIPPNNDPRADDGHSAPAGDGGAEGLTLTAVHRRDTLDEAVARSYAADLERAGASVRVVAEDEAVEWDLAARSWSAPWLYRNGRAFLEALLQSDSPANLGGYSDPEVDALIDRALALAVEPPAVVDAAWRAVERRALDDAAIVPLLFGAPPVPQRRSERTRDALAMPALGYAPDVATLWLATA